MIFCLNKTSENKVFKIILKTEISKDAGIDKLSRRSLLDAAEILLRPICEVNNFSISRGVSPDACKIAKVKPIYKKGKKSAPSNYRPISLLPIISQVIERIVHDQRNKFLLENNILYNFQSGIKANHLTNVHWVHLIDKTLKGFDEGLVTGMILIDLQRAFDTINYEVLLQTPKAIRF